MLPMFKWRVIQQKEQNILLGIFRKAPLFGPFGLLLFALRLKIFGRIDVAAHVLAFNLETLHRLRHLTIDDGFLGLGFGAANVGRVIVNQIFKRQTGVNKILDQIVANAVNDALNAGRVVRHRVKHLAVRMREPHVVFEEIHMARNVSHHHLLGDILVAFKQVGI